MSVKQFFINAKGKTVTKKVTGVYTVEDWPEMIKSVTASLIEQGLTEDDFEVLEDRIQLRSGQFIRKPKFKLAETGTLTERSKDYYFISDARPDKQFGDKKGAVVSQDNMTMTKKYESGPTIIFEIME